MMRRFPKGEIFHIFNKSIAGFKIFRYHHNCQRFIDTLDYYNNINLKVRFSAFLRTNKNFHCHSLLYNKEDSFVKFLCYVIMPDHYHLVVKVLIDDSLSKFLSDVENSFTRYFNIKYNRKGPLWQSSFKSVRVKSNEQLLHLSRYVHLNPSTANLFKDPSDWLYSSYRLYISNPQILKEYSKEISIKDPKQYKKFVEDRIDYQWKLKKIKKLTLD